MFQSEAVWIGPNTRLATLSMNGMVRMSGFCKILFLAALVLLLLWEESIGSMLLKSPGQAEPTLKTATKKRKPKAKQGSKRSNNGVNLHPENLKDKCVAVRFRGQSNGTATFSVDEAIDYMKTSKFSSSSDKPLSVGLVFLDRQVQDGFLSLGKPGVAHMYHFLEFLVVAFAELQHVATGSTTRGGITEATGRPILSQWSLPIDVPWVYLPMFFENEMSGVGDGINRLMANLILKAPTTSTTAASTTNNIGFYGIESNDEYTRQMHPLFTGEHRRRRQKWPHDAVAAPLTNKDYQTMQEEADAVFFVSRGECDHRRLSKMWASYIDTFPADAWHANVMASLSSSAGQAAQSVPPKRKQKIVVGYVDRQNTGRNMPEREHDWLVGYLTEHPMVDFRHLHMEDYSSLEQIRIASECDVLIGVHGNGLSHVLWMQPARYVIEIYWQFQFKFDYVTASQLMRHKYMGLFNGHVVDSSLVQTKPKALRLMPKKVSVNEQNYTVLLEEIEVGRRAIMEFLQSAMVDLGI